jgi:hypothetical protein
MTITTSKIKYPITAVDKKDKDLKKKDPKINKKIKTRKGTRSCGNLLPQ